MKATQKLSTARWRYECGNVMRPQAQQRPHAHRSSQPSIPDHKNSGRQPRPGAVQPFASPAAHATSTAGKRKTDSKLQRRDFSIYLERLHMRIRCPRCQYSASSIASYDACMTWADVSLGSRERRAMSAAASLSRGAPRAQYAGVVVNNPEVACGGSADSHRSVRRPRDFAPFRLLTTSRVWRWHNRWCSDARIRGAGGHRRPVACRKARRTGSPDWLAGERGSPRRGPLSAGAVARPGWR
jgi:hypothetical protein